MTEIERKEFKKVISKLVKQDAEGKSFIDVDEFNALYFTDENRKEIIEKLAERNIELRKIEKKGNSNATDELSELLGDSIEEVALYFERHANILDYENLDEVVGTGVKASFVGQKTYEEDQYANVYRKEIRKIVLDYLNATFDSEDVDIYKFYYGLDDDVYHTMEETSEEFKLDKSIVFQKLNKMDRKVKGLLWDNKYDDYIYDIDVASQDKRI